jgi:hypothetical protein
MPKNDGTKTLPYVKKVADGAWKELADNDVRADRFCWRCALVPQTVYANSEGSLRCKSCLGIRHYGKV